MKIEKRRNLVRKTDKAFTYEKALETRNICTLFVGVSVNRLKQFAYLIKYSTLLLFDFVIMGTTFFHFNFEDKRTRASRQPF